MRRPFCTRAASAQVVVVRAWAGRSTLWVGTTPPWCPPGRSRNRIPENLKGFSVRPACAGTSLCPHPGFSLPKLLFTLQPAPCTLHPAPWSPHSPPCTLPPALRTWPGLVRSLVWDPHAGFRLLARTEIFRSLIWDAAKTCKTLLPDTRRRNDRALTRRCIGRARARGSRKTAQNHATAVSRRKCHVVESKRLHGRGKQTGIDEMLNYLSHGARVRAERCEIVERKARCLHSRGPGPGFSASSVASNAATAAECAGAPTTCGRVTHFVGASGCFCCCLGHGRWMDGSLDLVASDI